MQGRHVVGVCQPSCTPQKGSWSTMQRRAGCLGGLCFAKAGMRLSVQFGCATDVQLDQPTDLTTQEATHAGAQSDRHDKELP